VALVCKAPCYPTACMLSPFLVRSGRAGSLNRNACIVLHVCVYIGRRAQVTEVIYVQKSERAHGALELLTCLMSEHVRAMVPFGATTCPSSTAESGGVECVPGVPRSAVSATCTVGAHCGGPSWPRFACSGEVHRAPQL
jgi:hypothetical protein